MYITADHLREQVIRPTLEYLGEWTEEGEAELLDAVLRDSDVGLFSRRGQGLGLFRITASDHRDLWDRYLAYRPDVASRVRGLASQRAFLSNPDNELQTNLSYCTAIAWLLLCRTRSATSWERSPRNAAAVTSRALSA
ncbi:MAG: hypothetical protein AAFY29_18935 [Pseudomonadota bacterium]